MKTTGQSACGQRYGRKNISQTWTCSTKHDSGRGRNEWGQVTRMGFCYFPLDNTNITNKNVDYHRVQPLGVMCQTPPTRLSKPCMPNSFLKTAIAKTIKVTQIVSRYLWKQSFQFSILNGMLWGSCKFWNILSMIVVSLLLTHAQQVNPGLIQLRPRAGAALQDGA